MKEDILSRANTILSVVGEIEERSPQTVAEYEQRLMERIKQTLAEMMLRLTNREFSQRLPYLRIR